MTLALRLDRRRLVGGGALGIGGLMLPGCATTQAERSVPTRCLPPVHVSVSRVIRTLVGLRPYRPSGFVVRAEPFADKRLVHNYGHGGAGITLSWGTSRLAVDLGLQGHQGPVAVLGAGIVGLTTARLVQEAGFPVVIYAAALPPETTSNIAGGQWMPSAHYRRAQVTPEWRAQYLAAADYSYRRFQILVGDEYGVRWMRNYELSRNPIRAEGEEGIAPLQPEARLLGPGDHPFDYPHVRQFDSMIVEPPRFLRQIERDLRLAGARIAVRNFASPADVAALPERLVFNCTGLGARALFGDEELTPIRGQLVVLLPQPEVDYALIGDDGYMFSRSDGIILGGTFEHGDWSTVTDPAATARILAAQRGIFGGLRCVA